MDNSIWYNLVCFSSTPLWYTPWLHSALIFQLVMHETFRVLRKKVSCTGWFKIAKKLATYILCVLSHCLDLKNQTKYRSIATLAGLVATLRFFCSWELKHYVGILYSHTVFQDVVCGIKLVHAKHGLLCILPFFVMIRLEKKRVNRCIYRVKRLNTV